MIFDRIVGDIRNTLTRVLEGLNGRLTFTENIQCAEIIISDTGPADSENTVVHRMGATPTHYIYNISQSGVVYDSRRDEWDNTRMYVKCSTANAQVRLIIL